MTGRSGSYPRVYVAIFLLLSAHGAVAALDESFEPDEVLVSEPNTYVGIVDPEYDSAGANFCWIDRLGNLWVGSIDPETGLLDPEDGKGQLVDTGAVTPGQIGNGPEWVDTARGAEIVYSKQFSSGRALARAVAVDGLWRPRLMETGKGRFGPFGSLNPGDSQPTISYLGSAGSGKRPTFLRELDDAASEQILPTTDTYPIPGARWIPNRKAVVFVRPTPDDPLASRQIFLYDMVLRTLEQLTFDAPAKEAVFMWQAPEYELEYIFLALLEGGEIGIYRKLDIDGDGSDGWTRIQTIDPPSTGEFIWSPEPFVFDDRSYIVMVTSTSDDQTSVTVPTEVWLADLSPLDPLYRRLSDDRALVRKDPEVFFAPNGPLVYASVTEGPIQTIYRLDTGLGSQELRDLPPGF